MIYNMIKNKQLSKFPEKLMQQVNFHTRDTNILKIVDTVKSTQFVSSMRTILELSF